jgi:hypothetical protein
MSAVLPHPSGAHLPHITLPIEARYQFAVDCGAYAAAVFFDEHPEITLHVHLPASLEYFVRQTRLRAAALGVEWSGRDSRVTDAYMAGYLGRIQQELRIIRPTPQPVFNDADMAFH